MRSQEATLPLKGIVTFIVVFIFGSISEATAAPIKVTDTKGREMIVEVLSFSPMTRQTKIKRLTDDKVFKVNVKVFDEASQKKIIAEAPPAMADLKISVSTGKRRKTVANSSYLKDQVVTATVKVENESREAGLKEGKFTILLVGRSMERYSDRDVDKAMILSKQTFTATIQPDGDFEYECKPVVTRYDSDRDSTNIGGWEFDGYLLVVKDEKGNVVAKSTNLAMVETTTIKDPALVEKALTASEGANVSRTLLPHGYKFKSISSE